MSVIRRSVLALAALMLAACAQPPVPQDHFYRLQFGTPTGRLQTPPLSGTLEVASFRAEGLTGGRPIVFTDPEKPFEVNEYHYHFWTAPPPDMLHDGLVTYLRASGVADQVVTPQLRLEPEYVLTSTIRRLEQVRGRPTKVAADFEFALRGRRDERVLLVKSYAVEKDAAGPSVPDAVAAMNGAVMEIYERLAADISRL